MKTSIKAFIPTLVGIAALTSFAVAQQSSSSRMNSTASTLSAQDRMFMKAAAIGGLTEVKEGQIAGNNGSAAGVKDFGQRMVTDHTQANNELTDLAAQKHFALPTSLDTKHKKSVNQLSNIKGAAFDSKYVSGEIKDHQDTIALFEREAARGYDPDVKAFASKTLPTLREHLTMVQALRGNGKYRAHRNMGGMSGGAMQTP